VFENSLFRRICGPKRDEGAGCRRKLHNEELHNFHSSLNIMMIKSNQGGLDGAACSMHGGGEKFVQNFGWKACGKRLLDLDVNGTILRWVCRK
jgi:hypothetical protein